MGFYSPWGSLHQGVLFNRGSIQQGVVLSMSYVLTTEKLKKVVVNKKHITLYHFQVISNLVISFPHLGKGLPLRWSVLPASPCLYSFHQPYASQSVHWHSKISSNSLSGTETALRTVQSLLLMFFSIKHIFCSTNWTRCSPDVRPTAHMWWCIWVDNSELTRWFG